MRILTFPDPALTLVRRFDPMVIHANGSGPGTLAIINTGSMASGAEITITGNCSALSTDVYFYTDAGAEVGEVETTGPFSIVHTLTAPAEYITLSVPTGETFTFTALTVDVV